MFASGVTEEDLPTEKRPEADKTTMAKLLFAMTGLYERWYSEMMETRRYQDSHDRDPNYDVKLRELEGQIRDIDREQHGFRMGNYSEDRGKRSWKDWVLGLVGLAIVAWLGRLSMEIDDLMSMRGEQKMMEEHLRATDSHIERLENRAFRGSP